MVDYDSYDDLLDAERSGMDSAELTARTAAQDAFIDALRGPERVSVAAAR